MHPTIHGGLSGRLLLLGTVILALTATSIVAQEPFPISSGSRVRVTVRGASPERLVGTLVKQDGDSLHVLLPEAPVAGVDGGRTELVAVPIAAIIRLDVSRGRRSRAGHGAAVGGLVGAATGLTLGILASLEGCPPGKWCFEPSGGEIIGVTAILGGLGAGIGALIGAASHSERWEQVQRGSIARLFQSPGGCGLALSVRF